jgi:hypothetical protein
VAFTEGRSRVKTRPSQHWALGRAGVVLSDGECGLPSAARPRAQRWEGRVLTRLHRAKSKIKKFTRLLVGWFGVKRGEEIF